MACDDGDGFATVVIDDGLAAEFAPVRERVAGEVHRPAFVARARARQWHARHRHALPATPSSEGSALFPIESRHEFVIHLSPIA